MNKFLSIFLLNLFLSKVSFGCQNVTSMSNFNSSAFYSGRWYVTQSFNHLIHYLDGNCAFLAFRSKNEITTNVVDDVGQNRTFGINYEVQKGGEIEVSYNVSLIGADDKIISRVRKIEFDF